MKNRRVIYYLVIIAILVLLFGMDLIFGSVNYSLKDLLTDKIGKDILFNFRIPKAIVALISGVALSVCGLQMQTLFRNPLADPYILGVSSGAGLGVAIYLMGISLMGINSENTIIQSFGSAGAALIGASLITVLIIYLSNKVKENLSLLIFGVMIGFIASALVTLLQYASNAHALKAYVLWTMGSFAALNNMQIYLLGILVIIGLALALVNIKSLNGILLGDRYAQSVGLDLKKVRRRILISTTLLVGAVTAFCGPIGFIGIAVPHVARFIFKESNHRVLLPASAMIGGVVALSADIISQIPGRGGVVPINTVAALLGIPVILIILLKNK